MRGLFSTHFYEIWSVWTQWALFILGDGRFSPSGGESNGQVLTNLPAGSGKDLVCRSGKSGEKYY